MIIGRGAAGARRAGPDDVAALVRMRGVMLEATAGPTGPDASWRAAAAAWFADQLARPDAFAAFVADVELGATEEAAGLYRSLGFAEAAHPTLRLRLAR